MPAPPSPPIAPWPVWLALLNSATDLLALLDRSGRVLWINAALERAGGPPPADVLGNDAVTLLAGPVHDGAWQAVSRALARGDGFDPVELPWRIASGAPRWGRLSARLSGQPEAPLLLTLQDTTETRSLQAEARCLAKKLDMAQEFAKFGLWEREIPSDQGRWDRHMFRLFGMEPGEAAPDRSEIARRIHPDDEPGLGYQASIRAAGRYTKRFRAVLPDGSVRRIRSLWEVKNSDEGIPARSIGIMVDDTEVYQLAESFNDTSAQLKLAVDLGNIAIWRHDLATDRMHYNERAFQMLGTPPRPEGMPLGEVRTLIHPDDLPEVIAAAEKALKSAGPVDLEARYRRPDGGWRSMLTRRVLRRDAQGMPIELVGVALDVTEQVEQASLAAMMSKRLEQAATAAGLGIWRRDATGSTSEWNAQMFVITGQPPELGVPTLQQWIEQFVHPHDRPALEQNVARTFAPNEAEAATELEFRIIRPDGSIRWLHNRTRCDLRDGQPVVAGVTMDVTERVLSQQALRNATERVALAARSVGVGTWESNIDTGEAIWDEAMFRLRGIPPSDTAPDHAQRMLMIHPEDRELVAAQIDDDMDRRKNAAYQFRVVWPDGTVRWLASRSTPAPSDGGQMRRRIGVNWDVTEARNAEIARQERAIAQRESAAKSLFLSRMSHELRTPLNAVLGFTQLLQLDAKALPPEQGSQLDHIRLAGEHLLSLINDVLDLSSLENNELRLDLQPVPLEEAVREALPLVESLAAANGISIVTGPLRGVVQVDRTRMRQVLINLLTNAIKYNRPRGRVKITTHAAAAGSLALRVEDTGRGMTPEQLAHLFEPFNRLGVEREGIEGTGIELAVTKALVENMGGSIGATSRPGAGTCFELRLAGCDRAAAPAATAVPSAIQPERQGTLLYIEDNLVNVLLLEELVRGQTGLCIESATSGEAGVARARSLLPDLVLIDIQLPDINGFEVLRRLREHGPTAGLRCIALSANAMPEDIQRATAAGFDGYWTKPIDFTAFLSALDRFFPS